MTEPGPSEHRNDELDIQLVNLLKNNLGVNPPVTHTEDLTIGVKFNGSNYSWVTLIKRQ